jgi:hypothetical protein
MKIRVHLLAVLLLFCCWQIQAADTAKTVIKVVVKNQFDKPVENAEVILDFLGGRTLSRGLMHKKIHWEIHTNQEGVAHFPPIPEGAVQLQINKKNYQTFGKKVDISGEEQTVDIKLEPPQSQYSAHPALKPADAPK